MKVFDFQRSSSIGFLANLSPIARGSGVAAKFGVELVASCIRKVGRSFHSEIM